MIRPVLTEMVLFLTPFALYAVFLFATRAEVFERASWSAAHPAVADRRRARAHDRELHSACAIFRRADRLDL